MRYSVDIERSVDALAYCIQKVKNDIENSWVWHIGINAGGIDYGVYFNFDIESKELEISNQPQYQEGLDLDEIIAEINSYKEENDD